MAEIIGCRSCIEPDCRGCNMYVLEKALKQRRFERLKDNRNTICVATEVRPIVRGEWLRTDAYPHWLYCSACYGSYLPNDELLEMYKIPMNYCPNCGADMRGEPV